MATLLLWVLVFQCLAIICWGTVRRDRMIQFPFLASGVFFGWILPQLVGLTSNRFLPAGGLEKTVLMAILCLGAVWWGYNLNRRSAKLFNWEFDRERLTWASAAMSLMGAYFFHEVSLLAPAAARTQWTGIITVYVFLSAFLTYGMVIALVVHLHKPGWLTASVLAFNLLFYLHQVVVRGRRAIMIELGLMLLLALWFRRRLLAPRWAMLATLVVGTLLINSIGDYRDTMLEKDQWRWSGAGAIDVLQIDYLGNLQRLTSGQALNIELTNAVMNIEATDRQMKFDFGLSHWNAMVLRYVPAQFIGSDNKQALLIESIGHGPASDRAYEEFRYLPSTRGSTATGLSDAFQSFWYFGAFNFFAIGFITSRWYGAAMSGSVAAQTIVILTMTAALHAITHSTHWYFVQFVQLAAFLLPVFVLARVQRQPHHAARDSTPCSFENSPRN